MLRIISGSEGGGGGGVMSTALRRSPDAVNKPLAIELLTINHVDPVSDAQESIRGRSSLERRDHVVSCADNPEAAGAASLDDDMPDFIASGNVEKSRDEPPAQPRTREHG